MFHPNVYANGEIYICIYKTSGHPHITSLLSLQASLATWHPNSPANAQAVQIYRENMNERVKVMVEESWLDPEESCLNGSIDGEATPGMEMNGLSEINY